MVIVACIVLFVFTVTAIFNQYFMNTRVAWNVWFGKYSPNKLSFAGKKESEVKEMDKVMYHDWRLIPKHMEQQFKDFEPLPEPPVRYVAYPPLLRAMLLAQQKKAGGSRAAEEPVLPLKRDVLLNKDYFHTQEQERQRKEGTAV